MPTYRWNTSDLAVGYDAAAEVVHPHYLAIQDEILNSILYMRLDRPLLLVDLGGGSGRLMERVLDRYSHVRGMIVDQSEPFLALAERRLARFGDRASLVKCRLQDDWPAQLPHQADYIVSMSAIHHLEPHEKKDLYRRCFEALDDVGEVLNGDEVRPCDDATYLRQLSDWADHMRRGMDNGAIPSVFHDALRGWIDRNVTRFGTPKLSGDDCHETIEAQLNYLTDAGFELTRCLWQRDLWAIIHATKGHPQSAGK